MIEAAAAAYFKGKVLIGGGASDCSTEYLGRLRLGVTLPTSEGGDNALEPERFAEIGLAGEGLILGIIGDALAARSIILLPFFDGEAMDSEDDVILLCFDDFSRDCLADDGGLEKSIFS